MTLSFHGIFAAVIVMTCQVSLQAQAPQMLNSDVIDTLRTELRTNHPSAAAAQARLRAAEANTRAVRLWEDPMAGLSVMAAEREMRRDDGDLMFSVEQVLPRPGLYRAQKSRAGAEQDVARFEADSTFLSLEIVVAQAAIELALADETLAISSNQLAWLEAMAANARQRLIDPASSAAEPLRLEGEAAQERQRLDAAKRRRLSLARQISTLLGRSMTAQWPVLRLPDGPASLPRIDSELARLASANPTLRSLASMAKVSETDINIARQERKPVFSVGADSRVYSGGRYRESTIGAKMSFPWFNRQVYQANIERARYAQAAAQGEYEALERKLRGEAIGAYTDAENAGRQAETFAKEVIPRLESAARATESAWVSAKATLIEVLDAQRALLAARLEQRRAVAQQYAVLETLRSIIPPSTP